MNIVACIKQVPDTNEVRIDSKTNNLVREGFPSIMNPFDESGVELALRLKERYGGRIMVVSMGPGQAREALQQALDMGADEAILLSDRAFAGSDTLATGYILAQYISGLDYDLILCGAEAIDGCTGQVGPVIAENLGIPQFTYVSGVEWEDEQWNIARSVGRYLEYHEAKGKILACVMKQIAAPRAAHPCSRNPKVISAREIKGLDPGRAGSTGSPTRVVKIQMADARQKCYVAIDDRLPARERIQSIINGGIESKEKVELIRGSSESLAYKILSLPEVERNVV